LVVHADAIGIEHVPVVFALHVCGAAHGPVEQHTPSVQ
jgi:hypothetical protein